MKREKGFLELTTATIFGLIMLAASAVGVLLGSVAVSRRTPPPSKAVPDCISVNAVNNTSFTNPNYLPSYTIWVQVCNVRNNGSSQSSAWITKYDTRHIISATGGYGSPGPLAPHPGPNGEDNCRYFPLTFTMKEPGWTNLAGTGTVATAQFVVASREVCPVIGQPPCAGCYADVYINLTFGTAGPTATPTLTPVPTATATLTPTAKPDLTCNDNDITLHPSAPKAEDKVKFSFIYSNIGNAEAYRSWAGIFVDDRVIYKGMINALVMGESIRTDPLPYTEGWLATPGSHTVKVKLDLEVNGQDLIDESNENNNECSKTFPVGAAPTATLTPRPPTPTLTPRPPTPTATLTPRPTATPTPSLTLTPTPGCTCPEQGGYACRKAEDCEPGTTIGTCWHCPTMNSNPCCKAKTTVPTPTPIPTVTQPTPTPTPTPNCVPNGGLCEFLRPCCSGCSQGTGFSCRCVACVPTPTPTLGFGKAPYHTDLNKDGKTNSLDWTILTTGWTKGEYNALDASKFLHAWVAQVAQQTE